METKKRTWRQGSRIILIATSSTAIALLLQCQLGADSVTSDPWQADDVVTPKLVANSLKSSSKPLIVCVGFDSLFKASHIPGSVYKGPCKGSEGVQSLTAWAKDLDRRREIVLYCGCCPWKQCPNIRPAFSALKAMGFTQVKVMQIDQDFPTNWTAQGFPTEKGN
jgi:thiosulfate/3-mercaptopyruvate sulfurtransferase